MKKLPILIVLIASLLMSCKEEKEQPIVKTTTVTEITETSAICGGEVINDGGAEVTARGVCWSINQNPTLEDNKTTDGNGVGNFTSNIQNLLPNTQYYVRAYATNEVGTSYGEEVSFTTLDGNYINGYEYVDLGLPSGLKWAAHNIGATMLTGLHRPTLQTLYITRLSSISITRTSLT